MKPEDLTQEEKEILIKAFEADKGNIRYMERDGNHLLVIDGKKLTDSEDDNYAKAFNKLIRSRLIEKKQLESHIYQLTEDGRKIVKEIQ